MQRYIDKVSAQEATAASANTPWRRFHRKWFKPGSIGVFIGKKGTGKTTLLLDICHGIRHCPEVLLFQKTYETNPAFHGIIPGLFCYSEWRPDVVRTAVARQKRVNKQRQRDGRPPKYLTIIVDDFGCDDKFAKDPVLSELFMNARWLKINFLFTMQFSLGVSPQLRANIDWIFMLKEIMPNNRDRLYNHYTGQFGDKKYFARVLDAMTQDRSCMVMNNTGLSNNLHDNFFVYKATPRNFNEMQGLKPWKMGSKAIWALNYRYYNEHYDTDEERLDDSSGEGIVLEM